MDNTWRHQESEEEQPLDHRATLTELLTQLRGEHPGCSGRDMFAVALSIMLQERHGGKVPTQHLSTMTTLVGTLLSLVADTVAKIHEEASHTRDYAQPSDSDPEFTELTDALQRARSKGSEFDCAAWKPSPDRGDTKRRSGSRDQSCLVLQECQDRWVGKVQRDGTHWQ